MIDRKSFFDAIRKQPFGGSLSPSQVAGMDAILDEWERRNFLEPWWLAYMLATTFHETAQTMQPIEEYGKGKGRPYGLPDKRTGKTYYGRGFVQLTWYDNYAAMAKLTGVDLLAYPEKALDLGIATEILFEGMIRGSFTGKRLADYFKADKIDPVNARRIINGTDKAQLVADYCNDFFRALKMIEKCAQPVPPPLVEPPKPPAPEPKPEPAKTLWQRWFGG